MGSSPQVSQNAPRSEAARGDPGGHPASSRRLPTGNNGCVAKPFGSSNVITGEDDETPTSTPHSRTLTRAPRAPLARAPDPAASDRAPRDRDGRAAVG